MGTPSNRQTWGLLQMIYVWCRWKPHKDHKSGTNVCGYQKPRSGSENIDRAHAPKTDVTPGRFVHTERGRRKVQEKIGCNVYANPHTYMHACMQKKKHLHLYVDKKAENTRQQTRKQRAAFHAPTSSIQSCRSFRHRNNLRPRLSFSQAGK